MEKLKQEQAKAIEEKNRIIEETKKKKEAAAEKVKQKEI